MTYSAEQHRFLVGDEMSETLANDANNGRKILERISHGEADALTVWFDANKGPLYAFVFYRVGSNADLASDVTQGTFMAALERLDDFDPEKGTMKNWLRYLSRNIIRKSLADHQRGEQLQVAWDNFDQNLQSAYKQIDRDLLPDEVVERDETRKLVSMALSNLPPQYRDALAAKYIDGRSLEAIADSGSTTIDAVKSQLRRARAAFRECFLALAKLEVSDV